MSTATMDAPRRVAGLNRRTFTLNRGLEYFTESELEMQIGAARGSWPIAILKELIDNALDAAEVAGRPPETTVTITDDSFTVQDNGDGLAASTLVGSLDYMVRVSDKLGYVTPTRGRLGNALKVTWAAPFVASDESQARFVVRARGVRHTITVELDRIGQQPAIAHERERDDLRIGTEITVHWNDSASLLASEKRDLFYKRPPPARDLIEAYAAFNPHATFTLNGVTVAATKSAWKKWQPTHRLVPHWYTPETFRDLVAHYVASERYGAEPSTVRAFVAGFHGLSSTKRQKEVTDGLQRAYLNDLVEDNDLDEGVLATLLARMQELSRPPKPASLGQIGREHLRQWMIAHADTTDESFKYKKYTGQEGGLLPYVLEMGFGVSRDDDARRRLVTGLNWSTTLDVPAGAVRDAVQMMRIDPGDPVVLVVHIAQPGLRFTGRGKGTVAL
jgi:DNA topoisomerase VI subunit B